MIEPMVRRGDFYEDDEPIEDLEAAFARGRKVVTARPSAKGDEPVTVGSPHVGGGLEAITRYYVPPVGGDYYSLSVRQSSAVATSGAGAVAGLGALPRSSAAVPSHS